MDKVIGEVNCNFSSATPRIFCAYCPVGTSSCMGNCNFIVLHLVQAPYHHSEDRNFNNDVAIKAVLQPPPFMREICENQKPTQEKNIQWKRIIIIELEKRKRCRAWVEGTAQYSTIHFSTVQYNTVQYSTFQYSTVQYSRVHFSTVRYSTVQYSTAQFSKAQYSTVLLSTVKVSTVPFRRVQYIAVQ